MNTVAMMSQAIGKQASIYQGGLTVTVRIMDAKQAYGQTRYLVTPVTGSGSVWVNSDRVSIIDDSCGEPGCDVCDGGPR
jgi:hypothetical protein